jgi:hypothetical protein
MASSPGSEPPDKKVEYRTAIIVAVIGALGLIAASVLPKLLDRFSARGSQGGNPSAQVTSPIGSQPNAPSIADTTNFERSPIAVLNTLDTVPPLRRKAVAAALFIGRRVTWGGLVTSVAPYQRGFVVAVRRRQASLAIFAAYVDSSQYDLVSGLRIDDSVRVTGRISRVDLLQGVWLDHATVTR